MGKDNDLFLEKIQIKAKDNDLFLEKIRIHDGYRFFVSFLERELYGSELAYMTAEFTCRKLLAMHLRDNDKYTQEEVQKECARILSKAEYDYKFYCKRKEEGK